MNNGLLERDAAPRFRSILIRATNWIGDTVMSLAAIREVKRLFPEARVTVMGRTWVTGLFEGQQIVDDILTTTDSGPLAEARILRQAQPSFDLALLFPNSFSTALAAAWARIPYRVGYRRDWRGLLLSRRPRSRIRELDRHQVYAYLDLLFQGGLSPINYLDDPDFEPDISLRVPESARDAADSLLGEIGVNLDRPRVVINPGAYFGPAKRWFSDRYAALADRLIETLGCEVLVVGSAGERRLAEEIAAAMKGHCHLLSGRTDLPCLLALIGGCRLFVTNDSGPMHLAAALNTPQIAIFGSTDEVATGPFSPRARTVHKHVACSPCLLRECPIDMRCFDRISVEEVFQQCRKIFEEGE